MDRIERLINELAALASMPVGNGEPTLIGMGAKNVRCIAGFTVVDGDCLAMMKQGEILMSPPMQPDIRLLLNTKGTASYRPNASTTQSRKRGNLSFQMNIPISRLQKNPKSEKRPAVKRESPVHEGSSVQKGPMDKRKGSIGMKPKGSVGMIPTKPALKKRRTA